MSREEEVEVARRARDGDEGARQELIHRNLRFATSEARKWAAGRGLDLGEAVAAANEGLVTAAGKFDPDARVKFISYAVHWITARLRIAALDHGACRIPPSATGRAASAEQKAAARASTSAVSLDAAPPDPDGRTLHEVLASGDGDPAAATERTRLRERLERLMEAHLTGRERQVVEIYYGLDDGGGMSQEEVARLLGITRAEFRTARDAALEKLRTELGNGAGPHRNGAG